MSDNSASTAPGSDVASGAAAERVTVPKSSLDFFSSAAPKLHAYVRALQKENDELRAQNASLRADTDILDSLSDFVAALSKTDLSYKQFMELKTREVEEAKKAQAEKDKPLRAPTEPLPPLKDVPPALAAKAASAAASSASDAAASPAPTAASSASAAVPSSPSSSSSPPPVSLRIRASVPEDLEAITAIYAAHVLKGTATFEEETPSLEEMTRRRDDVLSRKLPYLVATVADESGAESVIGYAYANLFRARSAYRFTLEHSIYLHEDWVGRRAGVGRRLLNELLGLLEKAGYRHVLAVIGDADNKASVALHTGAGFRHVGKLERVGFKFGRWIDVIIMQKKLGEGADTTPKETLPCEAAAL